MEMTSSAYIAQRITNALTFILQEKGIMGVNYIDDISCASVEDMAVSDFSATGQLLKDLGIWSPPAKLPLLALK